MNTDNIVIKDASVSDIGSLVKLLGHLFSIEKDFIFNAEKQKQGLFMMIDGCGKHKAVKVAQYKETIVGMCSVQTRISTAQGNVAAIVEDLIVDLSYRDMGIGKRLLEAVSTWAQKRGITGLQLLADKDNQDALDFYKRQNWEKTNLICLVKKL